MTQDLADVRVRVPGAEAAARMHAYAAACQASLAAVQAVERAHMDPTRVAYINPAAGRAEPAIAAAGAPDILPRACASRAPHLRAQRVRSVSGRRCRQQSLHCWSNCWERKCSTACCKCVLAAVPACLPPHSRARALFFTIAFMLIQIHGMQDLLRQRDNMLVSRTAAAPPALHLTPIAARKGCASARTEAAGEGAAGAVLAAQPRRRAGEARTGRRRCAGGGHACTVSSSSAALTRRHCATRA